MHNASLTAFLGLLLVISGCDAWHRHVEDRFGLKWTRDDDGYLRLTTVNAGQQAANAISSDNPDERREAVVWLCQPERSASDAVVKLLAAIVEQDPDPTVRSAAARALGLSPNLDAIEPLIVATNDRSEFVRLDAVRGLAGKHSDNVKRALLLRLTKDSDPQVRAAAAKGLAGYHEQRVLESLINALRDPDFAVVFMAEQSLTRMTGHGCDRDPEAWTRWAAGLGPDGDPFARAGQTPANMPGPDDRPWHQRMREFLHRAWFGWQADAQPQ